MQPVKNYVYKTKLKNLKNEIVNNYQPVEMKIIRNTTKLFIM